LEVDGHKQEVSFLTILLEESIEEFDELIRGIEGIVEVILGSSIASHGQTTDILCEMD
jgi:hypothetical protein